MTRQDWSPPDRRHPGGLLIAGIGLLAVGGWQIFIGYAIAQGEAFVLSGGAYWYRTDSPGWGWVNVAVGASALLIGLVLVAAPRRPRRVRAWAAATLLITVVSAVNQCLLAPQFPFQSTFVLAVDVFVIWAVTTQVQPPRESGDDHRIPR
ncbi:DUF7144 family membrane protein [Glycomyces xiaoerkulensis]|uniref:DUF7144 family membrane protein n=1 Tax=Glycomyces xiaoerkulensis TaxID=2038139 RepID=UPI000C25A572|nr:hypothetical protein [Glycomyces xiaoerkulensis]